MPCRSWQPLKEGARQPESGQICLWLLTATLGASARQSRSLTSSYRKRQRQPASIGCAGNKRNGKSLKPDKNAHGCFSKAATLAARHIPSPSSTACATQPGSSQSLSQRPLTMAHCWAGHSIRLPSFSTHGHQRWAAVLPQQEVVYCTWRRLLAHCAHLSHTQPHTLMCLHRYATQQAIAMFVCCCQHTSYGTTPSITAAHAECTRRRAHKGAAHAALSCASPCSRSSAAGSTSSTATCTQSSTSPPLALAAGTLFHSRFRLWIFPEPSLHACCCTHTTGSVELCYTFVQSCVAVQGRHYQSCIDFGGSSEAALHCNPGLACDHT